MNKICLLFIFITTIGFSQESNSNQIYGDSIVYNKNTNVKENRSFNTNLKEKYNGKEFVYVDDIKKPKKVKPSTSTNSGVLDGFTYFMRNIFPFLLAIGIVLIILKTFLGTETGFWNFKKSSNRVSKKLVYEDEDIDSTDFNALLQRAIKNKDYRLATRYYYLLLLKKLSDKKEIDYHKDKTNTEYLFEIQNKQLRNQFSEVSYIYSYVWYGEFPLDTIKFNAVEKKYKSILKV